MHVMAYIPHSSISSVPGAIPNRIQKKNSLHLFSLFASLVVFCIIIGTVGLFFYAGYVDTKLVETRNNLNKESDISNEKNIDSIKLFQNKLTVAKLLLDRHISPSSLLSAMEDSVNKDIQFESFDFKYDPGFSANLNVTGVTSELASLVLQEIQFNKDSIFDGFSISNVALSSEYDSEENNEVDNTNVKSKDKKEEVVTDDTERKVSFSVSGSLKKDSIEYSGKGESMKAQYESKDIIQVVSDEETPAQSSDTGKKTNSNSSSI